MANIDLSGSQSLVDMRAIGYVDFGAQVIATSSEYSWTSTGGSTVSLFSGLSNITFAGGVPTGGTIHAITTRDGGNLGMSVTGLSVSVSSLYDPTPATMHEKFWESILKGETSFTFGQVATSHTLAGDYIKVNAGQTVVGSADSFSSTLKTPVAFSMVGDAITVAATGKLTGGADVFKAFGETLVGDAGVNLASIANDGTIAGGNDQFLLSGYSKSNTMPSFGVILGDVTLNAGALVGGSDLFRLKDFFSGTLVVGDSYATNTSMKGGNDTFEISKSDTLLSQNMNLSNVVGDLADVNGGTMTGGNDTMNVFDTFGTTIVGDALTVGTATLRGGDDVISAGSSFGLGVPLNPANSISAIAGDANQGNGSTLFGGDDKITLTNISATYIIGDVQFATDSSLVGGNDTIAVSINRTGVSSVPDVFGDADAAFLKNFTGGNDTITVKISDPNSVVIRQFGDANFVNAPSKAFKGGNDTINVSYLSGSTRIYGDGREITTDSFKGGNDVLVGGSGNDFIYGDVELLTVTSETGGADILSGGYGNDSLFGGKGSDTADYSRIGVAVVVNLAGLSSTGADPFEAAGQGFDQLDSIENVFGSSKNDLISGNSSANRLEGRSGDDILSGKSGADTLFGGAGADRLTGGSGADSFIYTKTSESGITAATRDVITAVSSIDLINVDAIDAKTTVAGDQDFVLDTGGAFVAGEIKRVISGSDTILQFNTDNDATAEMTILVLGRTNLGSGDFDF